MNALHQHLPRPAPTGSTEAYSLELQDEASRSSKQPSMGTPLVAILLATLNGERFLGEQLDSYASQTQTNWKLWASDDGSSDGTVDILRSYQSKWGEDRLAIRSGPRQGFAKNFMSLASSKEIEAEYYAFSDQDDIWLPEKLNRAVEWLSSVPSSVPAMYCSRTELVDSMGQHLGFSPHFNRKPSFRNALVQNIAAGNTIVYNHAMSILLRRVDNKLVVVSHDWLCYLLVSGCGGNIRYEPHATVMYRQHDRNLVGANRSIYAKSKRLHLLVTGRFRDWIDSNVDLLKNFERELCAESRHIVKEFTEARTLRPRLRLKKIRDLKMYRQSYGGDLTIYLGALMGKI